jgi:hypothetical protein
LLSKWCNLYRYTEVAGSNPGGSGGGSSSRGGVDAEEVSLYHSDGEAELEEARYAIRGGAPRRAAAAAARSRPKSAPRFRPSSGGARGGGGYGGYTRPGVVGRGGVDGHDGCVHYLGEGPHGGGAGHVELS